MIKKTLKQLPVLILLLLILVFPYFVFGQTNGTMEGGLRALGSTSGYSTDVSKTTISAIIGTVVNAFLGILGILFLCLMLYGGFLWMTARGNEEYITKAKELMRAAVIGLIIVTASYAISAFVFSQLVDGNIKPVNDATNNGAPPCGNPGQQPC